jgi:hypothetical protein
MLRTPDTADAETASMSPDAGNLKHVTGIRRRRTPDADAASRLTYLTTADRICPSPVNLVLSVS